MAEERLRDINNRIAEILSSGEGLKRFYRFVSQNPEIDLHAACQIVVQRNDLTVCKTLSEWNDQNRRVIKGRKGLPYYDESGRKHYLFDAQDTFGDRNFVRQTYPIKRLFVGIAELNGTEFNEEVFNYGNGYTALKAEISRYLDDYGYLSDEDDERNAFIVEGVSFSAYMRTGFPQTKSIGINGSKEFDRRFNGRRRKRLFKNFKKSGSN